MSVFDKYKNSRSGVGYVFGSGPSLSDFVPVEEGVYISTNWSSLCPVLMGKVDFAFTEGDMTKDILASVKPEGVIFFDNSSYHLDKRFVAQSPHEQAYGGMPESGPANGHSEEDYPLNSAAPQREVDKDGIYGIAGTLEIHQAPNICGSTVFYSFLFAVHLGLKKIYVVGCDVTGNYVSMLSGWRYVRGWMDEHHPDVEVLIMNPVNNYEFGTV